MSIDINRLGLRIDGWADIVESVGDKAEIARSATQKILQEKGMPNVTINNTQLRTSRERPYFIIEMPNGACVTVYIGSFGQDLYASWDLYIRPVLNKDLIFIVLGIAAFLGFIGAFQQNGWTGNSEFSFIGWIFSTLGWVVGGVILVAIAGFITQRNAFAYFFKQLDLFDVDDIGAMGLDVHKGLLRALDSVGISSQSLRIKEQFHAGSRERII